MRFWNGLVNNLVNKIVQKSLFFAAFNRREYDHIHLLAHKLIWEMCVYLSYESLWTIAHPNVYDIRANVLLADGSKSMS